MQKNYEPLCQKKLFLSHLHISKLLSKNFFFLDLLVFMYFPYSNFHNTLNIMLQSIQQLHEEVLAHIQTLETEESLIEYRNDIVGKSGKLTIILK
jgi:hypothetical protein